MAKVKDINRPGPHEESFIKQASTSLVAVVKRNGKKIKDVEVPLFNIDKTAFVRKSTVLYGGSGSGKTFLTRDIMFNLRDYFSRVWVFCPTNALNNMYTHLVPNAMIYEEPTLEIITSIYEFQRVARQIYDTINKIETLRSLFIRIPGNQKARLYEHELLKLQDTALRRMREKYPNPVEQEEKADKINEIITEKLKYHYKQMIGMRADKLACMDLTMEEQYTLRYLGFCPDSLVIFDDAMTEVDEIVKRGRKEGSPVIQNFFFKGRHYFLSTIYCLQSDKFLDSELRKNAFTSIFTSPNEALGYFSKASNGFGPDEKRESASCIEEIFSEKNSSKHMKFVYLKDEKHKYQYTIAAPHTRFEMCGKAVRSFCDRIEEKSHEIDSTSKFAKKFNEYACGNRKKK